MAREHREADAAATVLTARVDDPTGYGRIVRDEAGVLTEITEHADADPLTLTIDEVNTSIYCFRRGLLAPALRRLSPENSQGEYYLTDALAVLREAGHRVTAVEVPDASETMGVNDRAQLAAAEAGLRLRINEAWMREGVTMVDPTTTYVDVTVDLAHDVRLLPGTILEGRTVVGAHSVIGPHSRLVDTVVGSEATVTSSTVLESEIGDRATVGPYAHVRPGTRVGAGAKIGSFVETKNAEIGAGAKLPHLSYIGDADVGEGANIGAGTITANYDGTSKHRTRIGRGAHTGSNTVLVAPVELGEDARTGAGAVVNRDVPPGHLAKGVPARSEPRSDPDSEPDSETKGA
ncbi:MAG: bifunctional UDP-N-acetylglucosamine diphosphorylase/glucosamine-1-phosphate N-acetyltransferase GlmU [Acidimicrobiia bacterium]|nr:bifunctional UDP-N-acetylglucosamine diphosphorylase/glucosamine-1-phosphate N-acetyltransferase GlmU [Acidimicrobiia bacterium]